MDILNWLTSFILFEAALIVVIPATIKAYKNDERFKHLLLASSIAVSLIILQLVREAPF